MQFVLTSDKPSKTTIR